VLNVSAQRFVNFGSFGTGPDEAHVALENIEKLRELVQTRIAQELSERGDQIVPVAEHAATDDALGAVHQTAKFVHTEELLVSAEPVPDKDDVFAVAQEEDESDGQKQWRSQDDQRERRNSVVQIVTATRSRFGVWGVV
jgi:hypothetical protein